MVAPSFHRRQSLFEERPEILNALEPVRTLPVPPKNNLSFFQRSDAGVLAYFALAQTFDLGEDVPHPVAGFAPGAKFGEDFVVVGSLRGDESFEVEGRGH